MIVGRESHAVLVRDWCRRPLEPIIGDRHDRNECAPKGEPKKECADGCCKEPPVGKLPDREAGQDNNQNESSPGNPPKGFLSLKDGTADQNGRDAYQG